MHSAQKPPLAITLLMAIVLETGSPGDMAQAYEPPGSYREFLVTFPVGELVQEPTAPSGVPTVYTASGPQAYPDLGLVTRITSVYRRGSDLFALEGPWLVRVQNQDTPEQVEGKAASAPLIEYFEVVWSSDDPDLGEAELLGEVTKAEFPGDELFCDHQMNLHARVTGETALATDPCSEFTPPKTDMDLPQAWPIGKGDGVVVAILDTGVEWTHPDLGGPAPPSPLPTLADSMLAYAGGTILINPDEQPGDGPGAPDGCPGLCGVDDDGDGQIDEDIWGLGVGNLAEEDVLIGTSTSRGPDWIEDTSQNWAENELANQDPPLYLTGFYVNDPYKGAGRNVNARILSNTATRIVTELPSTSRWDAGPQEHAYLVSDLLDTDTDGVVDDLGHQPGTVDASDDDENGYGDDIVGHDFVDIDTSAWAPEEVVPGEDYSGLDNDPRSLSTHGTWLASIVGAIRDSQGIAGIAPSVKILPVRIGYAKRENSVVVGIGDASIGLLRGLEYARRRGADIVVLATEFASSACQDFLVTDALGNYAVPLARLASTMFAEGTLIVNGSGNNSQLNEISYLLHCLPEMISVAGTKPNGRPWDATDGGSWVDISAQASQIPVAERCDTPTSNCTLGDTGTGYGWRWVQQGGTSLSSPQVGGVLALMRSVYPNWSAAEIRTKLLASTDTIDFAAHPQHEGQMGSGRVNAYKALTLWGDIPAAEADTTWSGHVWISGDIRVPAGRTLTILPGSVIHVAQDDILSAGGDPTRISFVVEGSIHWVEPSQQFPIVFESFADEPKPPWGPIVVVPGDPNQSIEVAATFNDLVLDSLTYPVGSEQLQVGIPVDITWTADHLQSWHQPPLDVSDVVDLYYSINDGATWLEIATGVPSLPASYSWTPQAEQISDEARVKIVFRHSAGITFGSDASDASFQVAAGYAFADRSADTGFDFTGTPYAAVPVDFEDDGDVDLFVTDQAGRAGYMVHGDNFLNPELPSLLDDVFQHFAQGQEPDDLRGATFADFDNDGDLDFFAASRTGPRLYRADDCGPGCVQYTDIGPDIGASALAALAADSWTGAWGDYDRDGLPDLFIGRAGTTGSGSDATAVGALADVLLHNDGGGLFSDASSLGINSAGHRVTVSAAWGDFDGDRNLDLCVGSRDTQGTVLYRNVIDPNAVQSFQDLGLLPGTAFFRSKVTSVHWADLDNDGDVDLVLGHDRGGDVGPRVFWNVAGVFDDAEELESGIPILAQTITDYDLDGRQDILLAPTDQAPSAPVLLRNSFAVAGSGFADVTAQVGLADVTAGALRTVAVADFGGSAGGGSEEDGDVDLYLGRPLTAGKYFYQAKSGTNADSPVNQWLRVSLRAPDGGNNRFGLGAKVTVRVPPSGTPVHEQVQVVDGGSGRGSQSLGLLTFGLGSTSDDVLVTVDWPDGYQQQTTVPNGNLNSQVDFVDDHVPVILEGLMQWYQVPTLEGTMDWYFVWVVDYSSDPALDAVYVENETLSPRGGPVCILISKEQQEGHRTLNPGDPDVDHFVVPTQDGKVRHTIIWRDRECGAPCTFNWSVTSALTPSKADTSSMKQFTIYLCSL